MEFNTDKVKVWLEANWGELTQLEKRLAALRFGIKGEKEHSVEQVLNELEIGRDRFRAIERGILKKMIKK